MTRIYIESKHGRTSEAVFLETLLKFVGKDKIKYEFIYVDGKDNLSKVVPKMIESTLEGGDNIIIFDADFPENGGGFKQRKSEIEAMLNQHNINASLFLFPDNSSDGDVETLLEAIMQKDSHKRFFDCYNDYECCLGNQYVAPNRKGKLHTYISAQKDLTSGQRKALGSGQWLFNDKRYWDLANSALAPIKNFLNLHIR